MSTVRARYRNGVLTPLEPLDLEEGEVVAVSIEAPPPAERTETILELFERLRKSVPPDTWDGLPTDWAKHKKHYLYGHPKEAD